MEFKTSAALVVALLGALVAAQDPASTLPVLYRVDQPTSNVVVFRGANVALARAAGLLKGSGAVAGSGSGFGSGSGDGSGAGNGAGNGGNGNGNGDGNGNGNGNGNGGNGNGAGNFANYYVPAPPPTTTTTTTPAPTTTEAPAYVPPPPPPAVYAPAPVVYRPAPVVSYAPAPVYAEPEPAGPANYNWEYAVNDAQYNDFGHKETRDGYQATGKYYVNLPDGRTQIVTYTADANGYTPVVEYSGVAQYPEDVKPTYNY